MQPVNRRQRRAVKSAIRRTDFARPINGVSHDTLTADAFESLCDFLKANGNVLSREHSEALLALCGLFTKSAQGKLPGRWAFALPTGMGKTSAIVEWCAALSRLGLDHVSVAVSASKVAALVELKEKLINRGVPEERIGLLYSPGSERHSLPPTEENDERQIMLVAHNRVRMKSGHGRFMTYKGKPRDLLIWDEGLIASDARSVGVRSLRNAAAWLSSDWSDRDGSTQRYLSWLTRSTDMIESAVLEAMPGTPSILRLPPRTQEDHEAFRSALPNDATVTPIAELLGFAQEELRVLPNSERGVVWYQLAVPREIENIIVLDASYPIRELVRADATIRDAEKELAPIKNIGKPLSQLKRHDKVTLHQLFTAGGREVMSRDFSDPLEQRAAREVVEVVKDIPADEDVLIFTFKDRQSGRRNGGDDYKGTLVRSLLRAGIDPHAKSISAIDQKPAGSLRINFATWGQETSLNRWAHCSNVILCGVLHRSSIDLASSYIGQSDNLLEEVSAETLKRLERSEVSHVIYQALSRGRCRVMRDGQALPMKGWIIHRDVGIQEALSSVMPGVHWAEWQAQHLLKPDGKQPGITASTVAKIVAYLRGLPSEADRLSTRRLKENAGLKGIQADTFTEALRASQDHVPWRMEGRSVIRTITPPT